MCNIRLGQYSGSCLLIVKRGDFNGTGWILGAEAALLRSSYCVCHSQPAEVN